jgi:hypothetical protein
MFISANVNKDIHMFSQAIFASKDILIWAMTLFMKLSHPLS